VISIHQRYRQTDRRTDGRTSCDGITAPLLVAYGAVKMDFETRPEDSREGCGGDVFGHNENILLLKRSRKKSAQSLINS